VALRPYVLPLKRRLTLDVTARATRIGRADPQNKEDEVVDHHSEALRRGPERAIEYCWVHNDDGRLPELAAEARGAPRA
jgi:hypothetical protein